jgi:hypothetical protein
MKQSYRCNLGKCRNITYCLMPTGGDLKIQFEKCSNCGRLIVFSTLYKPVLYSYGVPVDLAGELESRPPKIRPSFYSTEVEKMGGLRGVDAQS